MRAAFFLTLFANLAFLAWGHWVDVPQRAPANEAYSKLPRLKLVNEVPAGEARPSSSGIHKTALQAPAPAARCMSVGPFDAVASATRAAEQLRAKGFTPTQRSEEGEISKGFWVYIGGLKSDAEVASVLRILEQASIQDAHLMPESGEARRISVGLFSERQRADKRAQAVQKLGLQTEVTDRKLPGTVFWQDVILPAGAATLPPLDPVNEGAGSPIEAVPCPAATAQPGAAPGGPAPLPTKIAGASKVP